MKNKFTPKPPKKKRQSLAKKIFEQSHIHQKRDVAAGQPVHFSFFRKSPTPLDDYGFFHQADFLWKRLLDKSKQDKENQRMTMASLSALAIFIVARIADKDHKFFARLAAMIQHNRKPEPPHKLYTNICQFCIGDGYAISGTKENPCDANALTMYLKARGHKFSGYENQVPKVLRDTCNKLGIVLSSKRER